jgi:hypothetical protein
VETFHGFEERRQVSGSAGAWSNMKAAWELLAAALMQLPGQAAAVTRSVEAVAAANDALMANPPDLDAADSALRRAIAAGDDAAAVSEAHFLLGRVSERRGAFEAALEEDRAAGHAAPGTLWALRASDRADWLRARSEGGFEPLRRLEHVRQDPALANDPAVIDSLARDADTFPPGMTRVEARMLVAEAYLGRLHRPNDAVAELRKVVDDPRVEPLTIRLAERELVDALSGEGRMDEALAEARSHAARLDPGFAERIARLARRRTLRWVAYGVLSAFTVLVAGSVALAQRRGALVRATKSAREVAPVSIAFAAFVALGGGLLASSYERGNAAPFWALGIAVLPLIIMARMWAAVGSRRRSLLALRVALSGASVLAAAFALLDGLTPTYLDGFGL